MTHEGARKISDANFRRGVIAVLPLAAVEGVHKFAFTGDDANRQAAADNFAVGANVRIYTVKTLGAALMDTEAGDNFIENKRDVFLATNFARFLQKFERLYFWVTTLHRLNQKRGNFISVFDDVIQGFFIAVVEHNHVLNCRFGNTRRRWCRKTIAATSYDHFVINTVVVVFKHHHFIFQRYSTRQTHGTEYRFRTRITKRGALVAGNFAEQFGGFSHERMLRANFVADIQLLMNRFFDERRRVTEKVGAKTAGDIYKTEAVDIPQISAFGFSDNDWIDNFF